MDIKQFVPTCGRPASSSRDGRATAVPWHRMRQRSVVVAHFFTPFYLVLLLGSPAVSQTAPDAGSASREGAVVIAQRPTPAPEGQPSPTHAERRPPVAQLRVAAPSAPELLSALKRERSRVEALRQDLATTRRELEAARRETQTERQLGATLTQELSAAWANLKAMSVQLDQAANTTVQAKEAADAVVSEANEKAARERARSAALEQKLLAARKDVDAIRNGAQTAGDAREEVLRRDLAAARRDLDAMRRAGDDAAEQAHRAADTGNEQERALEQQRQRAEELARDLTTARREMEDLKAKAAGAIQSEAAALRARQAGEVTLADAKRALDEERHRLGAYERDLAAARQSLAALEARANLAATEQATAVEARKLAEATASRAGAALASESEKRKSLARDLDAARRERDAAEEELTRVLAAQRTALEQLERDNGGEMAAARREMEDLKAKAAGAIQSEAAALRARQAGELALADAKRALDEERHRLGAYERDLAAARQSLAALEARANLAATEQAAAVEARKLAEAAASRTGEALALESEKRRSLAHDLYVVRRERDTAKGELTRVLAAQRTALEQRERGIGDLAAAQREMEDLKAKAAGVIQSEAAALRARQAGEVALADAKRALDEERHKLGAYERDLAAARQSLAALEARADLTAAEQAGAVEARMLAETTASRVGEALASESEKRKSLARDLDAARREQADAKRALDEERHKLGAYERDLAAARQSLAALEARANLAAAEQAAAAEARKLAETAASRAGEALALESENARSLARDLDAARRERDAAKEELTRVLAAQRTALEQRERGNGRDLGARKERDILKPRAERRVEDIEQPKARAGNRTSERAKAAAPTGARSARDSGSQKVRKVQVRKPMRVVRPATIALPDALLPERLPVSGLW
ncbi:coiled-coil domain-containing protein [Sinorhizobium chiapasense]|uniref:TolA protein n=1 Tax=Sinorhizobium chiapasense TaxID=501572 RepID=A0ABZ2BG97_9HYPH